MSLCSAVYLSFDCFSQDLPAHTCKLACLLHELTKLTRKKWAKTELISSSFSTKSPVAIILCAASRMWCDWYQEESLYPGDSMYNPDVAVNKHTKPFCRWPQTKLELEHTLVSTETDSSQEGGVGIYFPNWSGSSVFPTDQPLLFLLMILIFVLSAFCPLIKMLSY